MKKICSIIIVAGVLIGLNGLEAQTTQIKPNQVELVKKLIGNWKAEWTDTSHIPKVVSPPKQFCSSLYS